MPVPSGAEAEVRRLTDLLLPPVRMRRGCLLLAMTIDNRPEVHRCLGPRIVLSDL